MVVMKDVRHLGHMVVSPEYTSDSIKLIGAELLNFWINSDNSYYSNDINNRVEFLKKYVECDV